MTIVRAIKQILKGDAPSKREGQKALEVVRRINDKLDLKLLEFRAQKRLQGLNGYHK